MMGWLIPVDGLLAYLCIGIGIVPSHRQLFMQALDVVSLAVMVRAQNAALPFFSTALQNCRTKMSNYLNQLIYVFAQMRFIPIFMDKILLEMWNSSNT